MELRQKITALLFFFFIAVPLSLSAAAKISDKAQAEIDAFMTFRMNLSVCETAESALSKIDDYHIQHFCRPDFISFTDEEKLILENFEVLEIYNYMRKVKGKESDIKKLICSQYNKNTNWFSSHKDGTINKWLYCTAADMLSCNLSYASVTTIMHDGLAVKTYYEKALLQDPDMSYALTNIAQWYYYAPSFGGGSKSKAKNCFEHAVICARTNAETYYAKIFLSQYLFEDETQRGKSATLLADADVFQPGGHYVEWLRRINKAGFSLYYYNMHKLGPADVDKAIGMI
ncbi:MAG: hypothetical protein M0P01_12835 [Treponema sp.]|nr:hypothetical protein [Treponema sp.]